MRIQIEDPRASAAAGAAPPLLSYGFRPLFLAAAGYAVVAMALWIALLLGWSGPPLALAPVAWHAHEMLFGFAGAGIGGFLLTAVPNWTGRPPLAGRSLAALALLWLVGRIAVGCGGGLAPTAVAVADLAFLTAILAIAAAGVIAADNRRNLPILGLLALLIVGGALSHGDAVGLDPDWGGFGRRLAMHVILLLIALIGGRIVPAFTGNWLDKTGRPGTPAPFGRFDQAVLVVAAVAAAADVVGPGTAAAGVLLAVAGILHLVRLGRWQGHRTGSAPIVWILHLGYLWLGLGSLVLGVSALTDGVPRLAGVHALSVGAIGTMLVAVMSRASLGHTGRALVAGPATVAVYGLVTVAALTRTVAPLWDAAFMELLVMSAAAWMAGFGLFFAAYLPVWLGPRADGR